MGYSDSITLLFQSSAFLTEFLEILWRKIFKAFKQQAHMVQNLTKKIN